VYHWLTERIKMVEHKERNHTKAQQGFLLQGFFLGGELLFYSARHRTWDFMHARHVPYTELSLIMLFMLRSL
jgi:uncharacterized metal-binding protein